MLAGIRLLGTAVWHFFGHFPEIAFFLVVAIPLGAGIALETLFPSLTVPLNAAWEFINHWWKAHPSASYGIATLFGVAVLGFLAWRLGERTSMEANVDVDLNEAESNLSCLAEAQTLDAAIGAQAHQEKPSAKSHRRL